VCSTLLSLILLILCRINKQQQQLGGETCCLRLPGLASVRSRGSTPLLQPPRPRPSPRPETEGVKIAGEFAGVILPAMAGVEAVRRLLNASSSIINLQLSQLRFESQPMTVLYSVNGCVQSIHTRKHKRRWSKNKFTIIYRTNLYRQMRQ
jgi:hypothetical protein